MEQIENMNSVRDKLNAAKTCGYTGQSVLNRLFYIYGFNVFTDLVRDVMHLTPMNCVKKVFKRIINDGIVDSNVLNERLSKFPFTKGNLFSFTRVCIFLY